MFRQIIYFSLSLMFFTSCEEYYTPKIDTIDGQLVVEAQITNDPSKSYVKLTKTVGFYANQTPTAISEAIVRLVDVSGNYVEGTQSGPGYFNFNTIPVSGNKYKLRILYNNDTYESEEVTMPPIPTVLSAYSENIVEIVYKSDAYGAVQAYDTQRRAVYFDLSANTDLSYYRFDSKGVIEWYFVIPYKFPPPPPNIPPRPTQIYGWESYSFNNNFNIAGPKPFSDNNKIEKHPILSLSYESSNYLLTDTLTSVGWIMIIDQYGTSKGSYDFHDKMNNQFTATGSLFDPIQTQIYGNITCINDPSKIAFGYFDLNSYRQCRYFINPYLSESDIKVRQIFRYPVIPGDGQVFDIEPNWWEW